MRFLGIGRFTFVAPRLHVLGAVLFLHFLRDVLQRCFAQVDGVGTHVGNVPRFIEVLRDRHGAVHGKAELAAGFLLKGGRRKRIGRRALLRLHFDVADAERGAFALQ